MVRNMYKESLFNYVRNEKVIIWAGAGLSLYAGYPSGSDLFKVLISNLSDSELEQINQNGSLSDLAEEFFRVKGNNKNQLISVIKKTFNKVNPGDIHLHEKLRTIPHFRTFITTNYDSLFERAFGQDLQVLTSSEQIPYLNKGNPELFKVHGDLEKPERVIITTSDYNNFFKIDSENSVYWNVIKERLSTNNILFIGYNLDDSNVNVILDKVSDVLGSHRKEMFLVAPKLKEAKKNHLIQKGIHYIDDTAENLIQELIDDLKDNIVRDFDKGIVSPETFRKFCTHYHLEPAIKGTGDSFKLKEISPTNPEVKSDLRFTVLKNDEKDFKRITDFVRGTYFGELEIPAKDLKNIDLRFNDIKVVGHDDLDKLKLSSKPTMDLVIDVEFDSGYQAYDIPLKIFVSKRRIEFKIRLKNADFSVHFDPSASPSNRATFRYDHDKVCGKVRHEIHTFEILKEIAVGQEFKIYVDSELKITRSFPTLTPLLKEVSFFLKYFKSLKLIEEKFDLRFTNFEPSTIDEESYSNILFL